MPPSEAGTGLTGPAGFASSRVLKPGRSPLLTTASLCCHRASLSHPSAISHLSGLHPEAPGSPWGPLRGSRQSDCPLCHHTPAVFLPTPAFGSHPPRGLLRSDFGQNCTFSSFERQVRVCPSRPSSNTISGHFFDPPDTKLGEVPDLQQPTPSTVTETAATCLPQTTNSLTGGPCIIVVDVETRW